MDTDALDIASEISQRAGTPHLLAWLQLGEDCTAEQAQRALKARRAQLQGMQHNPKHRAVAKLVIKHQRQLQQLLEQPQRYLSAVSEAAQLARLPMLELAIGGVLADGVLTAEEERFVRRSAAKLGISHELYERVLHARAKERGVSMPAGMLRAHTGSFRVATTPLRTHVSAGKGWWTDRLTQALVRTIPNKPLRIVELSCGMGWSALSLLPLLPEAEYLGVDTGPVEVAQGAVAAAGLAERALFKQADPGHLPLPDGQVDLVLCIMSLQDQRDTLGWLREARRLLRPGGQLLVVEPDGFGQRFYFDGPLTSFDVAYRALCLHADGLLHGPEAPATRGGFSLGPQLSPLTRAAGLTPTHTTVHLVQSTQRTRYGPFSRRLHQRVHALREAAYLPKDHPLVIAAEGAMAEAAAGREGVRGVGVHTLPLFIVSARV